MASQFTPDTQQALQHAVQHSNDLVGTEPSGRSKAKRRVESGDGHQPGKVKRRKSGQGADKQSIIQNQEPVIDPALHASIPAGGAIPNKTGKKKKSEKEKQRADTDGSPSTQGDPSAPHPETQTQQHPASTAAFLSALVAAASAVIDQQPVQDHPDSQPHFDNVFPLSFPGPIPPCVPVPTPPFQYPLPSDFADQANAFFPGILGEPSLPELASNANEEILRHLHDVDITKLQSVLKTLGEAAASAHWHVPPQQGFLPMPQPLPPAPPVKQNPVPSYAILGQPPKSVEPPRPPIWEQHGNPAHAELLATKWMNASKLAQMVETEGLVFHKGKFSEIEQTQLKNALEAYRTRNGLSQDQLNEIIFSKEKAKDKDFWSEITCAVPLRPIIAVYHFVRRAYHPLKGQGKWTTAQDALLKQAVNDYGQQWEKVSERVGRMASDCRDRYRNHIADRDKRKTGTWLKEEEDELTAIVTEMTIDKGKDMDSDIFWGVVSQRMGNKRGRQQCRIKWIDSLSKTLKNDGAKPRWTTQDAYVLIHKIDSLNVRHDSEVDWKKLPDPDWNLWSPHILQRRWTTMKRSIKGYENMSHHDIMDILRLKKASHLSTFSVNTSKKRVKSNAVVQDDDVDDNDGRQQAGSSTGVGTQAGAAEKDNDNDQSSSSSSD